MMFTPVTGLIVTLRHFLLGDSVFIVVTTIEGKGQEASGESVERGVSAARVVSALDGPSGARIALAQLKDDAQFMSPLTRTPFTITKETSQIWNVEWTRAWRAPRGGTYYQVDPNAGDEDA